MQELTRLTVFLDQVMPRSGDRMAAEPGQNALQVAWRDVAGEMSRYSQPLLFESGRVVILCQSSTWASLIRHRRASLLQALKESGVSATRLEVKNQAAILHPKPARPPRTVVLSESSANCIAMTAEMLEHPGLKRAFARLAKHGQPG